MSLTVGAKVVIASRRGTVTGWVHQPAKPGFTKEITWITVRLEDGTTTTVTYPELEKESR